MRVFVEVHNRTRSDLSLDRLTYRLVAENWFDARGEVKLDRVIIAGASAIVEISVPVQGKPQEMDLHGVPYTLKARLFVTTDKVERSWELNSKGSLASSRHSRLANRRVAAGL